MLKRIKYIFGLEWKYARLAFFWNVVEQMMGMLTAVAVPFITKLLIDTALTVDAYNIGRLTVLATGILALKIFESVLANVTLYYRQDYLAVREIEFRRDISKKVLGITPECFENPETYDMYSRVAEYTLEDIHNAFYSVLGSVFKITTVASVAAVMIGYSPIISLIYVVAYIPLFILKMKFQKKLAGFKIDNTANNRKKNAIFDFVHDKKAVAELKLFGAFPFVIGRRNEITKRLKNEFIALTAKNETKQAFVEIIPDIIYYTSYAVYAMAVVAGSITFGDLTFLVTAMKSYSDSLFTISISLTHQRENIYMVDRLIDLFELPEERPSVNPNDTAPFEALSLENVTFTYPGSTAPTLRNISLKLNRGEKTAFVGYNGSGKTTTVKLLLGLFDSYSGTYRINGTDVRNLGHSDIYGTFSVGMQDYMKYPFSVRENIEISANGVHDDSRFANAVRVSGVDKIELPHGYDTCLNKQYDEGGIDLSEGQWHRLILARTVYQSHDVMIFDEPTSSLDPISEYEFVRDMKNCFDDKTVIMVTHRLSSVVDFDRIIVLRDGEIVGDGSHEQLMKSCDTYREMFETQASRYSTE